MAKITSLNGAQAQALTFDPLLPVELVLPFPGHWGQIRVVYSVVAVMDLAERWDALMTDLNQVAAAVDAAASTAEAGEAKRIALSEQRRVRRQVSLRIIGATVDHFSWPFQQAPPDPTNPADFEKWPDLILNWLSETGLTEVRKRVDDPLLWTASAAT